jgi:Protein of unknown function (DUF4242)
MSLFLVETLADYPPYVSRDRTHVVCELNSPDAEIIRTTHRRFDIPCDRIWPAMVIKP